jgi:hypothetical protein
MTTPFSRLAIAIAFAGTTGAGIGTLAAQQSPFKPPSNLKVLLKGIGEPPASGQSKVTCYT